MHNALTLCKINMKALKTINNGLIHLEEGFSAATMLAMCLVVFASVICRFANISFPAADEVSRYFMIFCIYSGIIVVTRKKAHVNVEAFVSFLGKKTQKFIEIIVQITIILMLAWLTYLMIGLVGFSMGENAQRAPITRIPFWFLYCSLVAGFALSMLRQIQIFVLDFIIKKPAQPVETEDTEWTL